MLLYNLVKIPAHLAVPLYVKKLQINKPACTQHKGPVLLACNHPNSFLDAIILSSIFKEPIFSLARGDAFNGKTAAKILRGLNMLPVYRTSEGVENLEHNYDTFTSCIQLFREQKIVLIFSEGLCVNEWHLRPLKKGTARLAIQAWEQNIPLTVQPLGINYNSFRKFGKTLHLNFGTPITSASLDAAASEGKKIKDFNTLLAGELAQLVYEIEPVNKEKVDELFGSKSNFLLHVVLWPFAIAGILLHWPLYAFAKDFSKKKSKHTDHFDSIMVGALFLAYPFYLLLFVTIASFFIGWFALSLFVVMPVLVRAYLLTRR